LHIFQSSITNFLDPILNGLSITFQPQKLVQMPCS